MKRWFTRILICFTLGAMTTVAVAWGCAIQNSHLIRPVAKSAEGWDDTLWTSRRFRRQYDWGRCWVTFRTGGGSMHAVYWGRTWPPVGLDNGVKNYAPVDGLIERIKERMAERPDGLSYEEIARKPNFSNLLEARADMHIANQEDLYIEEDAPHWIRNHVRSDHERCRTVFQTAGWPMQALVAIEMISPGPDDPNRRRVPRVHQSVGRIEWNHRDRGGSKVTLPCRPIPFGFVVNTVLYGSAWFVLWLCWNTVFASFRYRAGVCPHCGYDLRLLAHDGCPECGWNRNRSEHNGAHA